MNPLDSRPRLREAAYLVQWLTGLILGGAGVVLPLLDLSPQWYVIATALAGFVWSYLGLTAQRHVTYDDDQQEASRG